MAGLLGDFFKSFPGLQNLEHGAHGPDLGLAVALEGEEMQLRVHDHAFYMTCLARRGCGRSKQVSVCARSAPVYLEPEVLLQCIEVAIGVQQRKAVDDAERSDENVDRLSDCDSTLP